MIKFRICLFIAFSNKFLLFQKIKADFRAIKGYFEVKIAHKLKVNLPLISSQT